MVAKYRMGKFRGWFLWESSDLQGLLKKLGDDAHWLMKGGQADYETGFEILHSAPPEFGQAGFRFDAHGMAKCISAQDCLNSLAALLKAGVDPNRSFHTAKLAVPEEHRGGGSGVGTAGGTPYYDSAFIVVSGIDQYLKDGIRYVIVNEPFVKAGGIPVLQKSFPNVRFVPVEQAPAFFIRLAAGSPTRSGQKDSQAPAGQVSLTGVLQSNGIQARQHDPQTVVLGDGRRVAIGQRGFFIRNQDGTQAGTVLRSGNVRADLTSLVRKLKANQVGPGGPGHRQ